MERTKGETKFPLGGDLFLTVNLWKGQPKIHIRKFKALRSLITPGKVTVIPTRFGVCLDKRQFEQVLKNMPAIFSELSTMTGETMDASGRDDDVTTGQPIITDNSRSTEEYASSCEEFGTSHVFSSDVECTPRQRPSHLRQIFNE